MSNTRSRGSSPAPTRNRRARAIGAIAAVVLAVGGTAFVASSAPAGAAAKPVVRGGQTEPFKPFKNVKHYTKPKAKSPIRDLVAASTPMTALIDGDSVTTEDGITDASGATVSLEQYAAEQLGYTVTVVDGATWDSMTAAQFASYQLLIVGDPICSSTSETATSDASTWAPVVMGTAGLGTTVGNRTVIGTDPEYHYLYGGGGATPTTAGVPTSAGAEHLVQDGIDFAGAVSGATGIYFDTSCSDNGSDISVLDQLTTATPNWTEDSSVPCGGSVQQIASNPAFDSGATPLQDTDIEGWECSDHVTFPQFPTDFDALAVATDTATLPTCGTDPDSMTEACGEAYVLIAGTNVTVTAPDLTLTPTTHSDPTGGTHTVTATVTTGSPATPLSGAIVSFAVTGQNGGASGTCTTSSDAPDPTCATGSDGEVLFTYSDANGAGMDTINGSVTIGPSTEHASAAETWTSAAAGTTTTTSLSGGGATGATISVPQGTAVTDQATLAGTDVANATGTVTYSVYSDADCTVSAGTGGTVGVTGGSVGASSAVTLTTPGTYYWQAVYSGDSNNTGSSSPCGSEVETVTSTTEPLTCALTGTIAGPPKQIQVTVQAGAGLKSVVVTEDVNATVDVPTFTTGDTAPLVVTATKTVATDVSELALTVTDTNGQTLSCDPAEFTVTSHAPNSVGHLASAEHFVTITNSGLSSVTLTVNGVQRTVHLGSAHVVNLDLASLFHGSHNKVVVHGKGSGSADILLRD